MKSKHINEWGWFWQKQSFQILFGKITLKNRKITIMTWKYKGMKTWKPLFVWWTLRNKQNDVNNVWMFLWKFVVMWMLQVVYRVHYVLWCCLVCLQHYFCLHAPDYCVGNVEWERKKENSHSISISITFPHFIIVFQ